MMADDVVIMVPSEPVEEGKAACESFLRGMLGWTMEAPDRHIEYVSAETRVIGGYAFDRGSFSFTATPKGTTDTTHVGENISGCTRAMVMATGRWRDAS